MQMESFYEIELKALITKEQYDKFCESLPKEYTKINDDVIHSTRYRPGDIQLRYSNKIFELVHKTGEYTKVLRNETKISFDSKEDFDKMQHLFSELNLQTDPSWTKHNQEFQIQLDNYNYVICLQEIKNFAYIVEVQYLSNEDDFIIHERNIKSIFKRLNLEPIDPKDFNARITQYIMRNKKLL